MLSENLRARLERLNREALPAAALGCAARETDPPTVERPNVRPPRVAPQPMPAPPSPMPLGESIETPAGEHWLIRQPVAAFWPGFADHFDSWQADRGAVAAAAMPRHRTSARARRHAAEVDALAKSLSRGVLFLDLETCGLAGSALFLIGLLRHDGEQLVLEQLLARNYAEEHAVLHTLWGIAGGASLLVTFNGKSFDWPLVRDRSTYHRIGREPSAPALVDLPHVDVLHHARRRWRRRLPDCRLQTLERFLCGRHRSGDIPGREIPQAYRQYVATGRTDQMRAILHHNALDLVTLLEVAMILTRGERAADDASGPPAASLLADEAA